MRQGRSRYAVNKWAGGRTLGSATMPYTRVLLFSSAFRGRFHLINFHFIDKTDTTIYDIVVAAFQHTGVCHVFYTFAMAVLAIHISHGLWSAFQTLGANHSKYMPLIRNAAIVFSILVVRRIW